MFLVFLLDSLALWFSETEEPTGHLQWQVIGSQETIQLTLCDWARAVGHGDAARVQGTFLLISRVCVQLPAGKAVGCTCLNTFQETLPLTPVSISAS